MHLHNFFHVALQVGEALSERSRETVNVYMVNVKLFCKVLQMVMSYDKSCIVV